MPIVAPSLLAADFLHLADECKMVDESEADWFHLDIMDGCFVPNISYGPMIIQFVRKTSKKLFDVHLMVVDPGKLAEELKTAGADSVTVHLEACPNLHRNIQQIKSLGMKAGVSINPHTRVDALADVLQDIDVVCMMSVNPGYGAQKFIPHTLEKIKDLKSMIRERNLSTLIEVDGGVNLENAASIVAAGADVLVAGNTVFSAPDPKSIISKLKSLK